MPVALWVASGPSRPEGGTKAERAAEETACERSEAGGQVLSPQPNEENSTEWGGELRKHFSKERCSQTAMPFFAVFPLYFGLFLSPVQNQMHR